MRITCNKCGHSIEASAEQLASTGGVAVCPACLSSMQVPKQLWTSAAKPKPKTTASPPQPATLVTQPAPRPTPPAYKPKRRASAPPQPPRQPRRAASTSRSATPQRSTSQKPRASIWNMSHMGCLLFSIVFTVLLLTILSLL